MVNGWVGMQDRTRLGAIAALFVLAPASAARAHGGGLNSDRCHTNRKTGDYHCPGAPTWQVEIVENGFGFVEAGTAPFRNCKAARAAGAAPVRLGEPGYGPHLDRDGDGIGCE